MTVDIDRLSRPERLLWGHGVRRPEHIDLEAIAGASGAHVIYRKLDGCAARLVAAGDHAVISVAMDDNLGRRRFSLGHELAHWMQDAQRALFQCSSTDIGPQNAEAKSIEADAKRQPGKNASGVQKLKRTDSDSEALSRFNDSDSEAVAVSLATKRRPPGSAGEAVEV